MEKIPLEIDLNFDRRFFEEIYYKNNNGNIFFNPQTKNYTIAVLILTLALVLTRSNYSIQSNNWGMFYFTLLLEIVAVINLIIRIISIIKWKKSIKKYLDFVASHKKFKLIADENTITIMLDENITKEKWTELKSCEINDNYISIASKYDYFLPKKAMSETEYQNLKNIITKKIDE